MKVTGANPGFIGTKPQGPASRRHFFLGMVASAAAQAVPTAVMPLVAAEDLGERKSFQAEAQAEAGNLASSVETKHGFFYCWFGRHAGPFRKALSEEIVSGIHRTHRLTVFAPEVTLYMSEPILHEKLGRRLPGIQRSDEFCWALRTDAREYLVRHGIPVALTDFARPEAFKLFLKQMRTNVALPALGILLFSSGISGWAFSRRHMLAASSAMVGGVMANTVFLQRMITDSDNPGVELRNAMIALKLLKLAQYLNKKENTKPAFLLTMGVGHTKIIDNLQRGESYNVKIARQLLSDPELARCFGEEVDAGFYLSPESSFEFSAFK